MVSNDVGKAAILQITLGFYRKRVVSAQCRVKVKKVFLLGLRGRLRLQLEELKVLPHTIRKISSSCVECRVCARCMLFLY